MLVLGSSTLAQQKFEPTIDSYRQAIARGQVKEFVAAMEALGTEAEKNERWAEASYAFHVAGSAARNVGQLQKAIDDGFKAVELGQKAKDPRLQADPTPMLAIAYQNLRQFEKQKEWLLKGIEISKQITTVTAKQNLQARLYGALGQYYLERGEFQKAIEHISYSVQQLDELVSFLKRNRERLKNASQSIRNIESNLTAALSWLGNAYLQAGNSQGAIKAFEQGLAMVKNSKLDFPGESFLVHGLGAAYLAQKDYGRAMEQFNAALQMAENRRQSNFIVHASRASEICFCKPNAGLRRSRTLRKLQTVSSRCDHYSNPKDYGHPSLRTRDKLTAA
jgi:tetratricopeptide (TPR) repeat protein